MSSLGATYLVYAALALPLVSGAAWSLYRHGAPILLDFLDADEMLVAAIHRLVSVGYGLLGLGVAATLAPSGADVRAGALPALVSAWAALLVLLGIAHVTAVAVFLRARHVRQERTLAPAPAWYGSPLPPSRPFAPPVAPAPAPMPASAPVMTAVPAPPFPPPWCVPPPRQLPPLSFDPWAPPRR